MVPWASNFKQMSAHRFTIRELENWSDAKILQMIVNDKINNLTNPHAPLSQRLRKISRNLDNMLEKGNISPAVYVTEVTVNDPNTSAPVELSVYKDSTSGGMFGIDSSFVDQMDLEHVTSPFNPEYTLELVELTDEQREDIEGD